MSVTRQDIVWAYRLFLEREPESDWAIEQKMSSVTSVAELRAQFMASPEFQNRSGLVHPSVEGNVVIKEIDGLRLFLDLSDLNVGLNIVNGVYEPDELELMRRIVKQGQNVVDVGANIGFFSIILGDRVGASGHVYAFEPLRRNSTLLARSIIENGFQDRMTLESAAVGNSAGTMELISARITNNWGGAYLRTGNTAVPPDHEVDVVQLVKLDDYPFRRPISFMKIDAEGAEPLVLQGGRAILETDRPVVLAELNREQLAEVSGSSPNELIQMMHSLGYDCRLLETGGRQMKVDRYESDDLINAVFSVAP